MAIASRTTARGSAGTPAAVTIFPSHTIRSSARSCAPSAFSADKPSQCDVAGLPFRIPAARIGNQVHIEMVQVEVSCT
ncbi:hypothetical protein [Nocardia sp. CA-135398]|uniref:hypothetical protein n=1 Tax=Nocardia sp. CA-135398 TaxID=3239977 RepID=UPI003D972656